MKPLDYSAFSNPLTKEDYAGLPNDPSTRLNKTVIYIGIGIGLFAVILSVIIGVESLQNGGGVGALFIGLFFCIVLFAIGFGVIYGLLLRRQKLARLMKFARMNSLKFRYDTIPLNQKGLIFDNGHSRKIHEVFQFPDGFEIGNYEFVTGNGKSQKTHNFVYARIALSRHLPNMVLDARSNNFLGFSNLPDVLHKSQQLQLEGNFNEHFDVYVPVGFERDALYVFTPDVMHVLLEHGKTYDMEIVDNELYVYRVGSLDFTSKVSLSQVLEVIAAVSRELRDQTKRYSDERVPQAQAGAVVSAEAKRLKRGVNYIFIFVAAGFLLLQFGEVLLPREFASVAGFIFSIGLLILLLRVCLKAIRRRP